MEKEKLKIIYKKIDEIKPYPNNPRKNDDAVDMFVCGDTDLCKAAPYLRKLFKPQYLLLNEVQRGINK